MSVFKSQFSRALAVIPSSDCDIPSPYVIVSSVTTDSGTNLLIDDTTSFVNLNVQTGDIVYCPSNSTAATVVSVIDENTLELNAGIVGSGDGYTIYQASAQTGLGNQGCCLLGGADGGASVVTIGGDTLDVPILQGVILPLQVKKVTSAVNVIALW